MHGIYWPQPSGMRPRASVQQMPYIPRAPDVTITYIPVSAWVVNQGYYGTYYHNIQRMYQG